MIDNTNSAKSHNIIVEKRKKINMSGINRVDNFNENEIILLTELGELTIKGTKLHISKMDVDSGDVVIDGNIIGLIYNEVNKSNSVIKRIFR